MFTMLPPSFIARPAACAIQYEPFRLMSMTRRKSSGSSRDAGTAVPMPALLMRTSTWPSCDTASSTTRRQSSGLATAAGPRTPPPAVLRLAHVARHRYAALPERLHLALGVLEPLRAPSADRDVGAG